MQYIQPIFRDERVEPGAGFGVMPGRLLLLPAASPPGRQVHQFPGGPRPGTL